jgi:hypothetical protein
MMGDVNELAITGDVERGPVVPQPGAGDQIVAIAQTGFFRYQTGFLKWIATQCT